MKFIVEKGNEGVLKFEYINRYIRYVYHIINEFVFLHTFQNRNTIHNCIFIIFAFLKKWKYKYLGKFGFILNEHISLSH